MSSFERGYRLGTQEQNKFLLQGLVAAKHLLLAAKGPDGGPTSWTETREKWLEHFGEISLDKIEQGGKV